MPVVSPPIKGSYHQLTMWPLAHRSWCRLRESALANSADTTQPVQSRVWSTQHYQVSQLNPRNLFRLHPFTSGRFHALLNSLFKVLFNFPSRYLFAIGLGVIFSLTWSLPRALSCTPKQLDSGEKSARPSNRLTGLSPSAGRGPCQGGLGLIARPREDSPKHHMPRGREDRRFGAGLRPFHSPLLRASRLFSFPPLINMLKFGG